MWRMDRRPENENGEGEAWTIHAQQARWLGVRAFTTHMRDATLTASPITVM